MDPIENPYKSPGSQSDFRENQRAGSEGAPWQLTEAKRSNAEYWLHAAALGLIIISLLELCAAGLGIFFISSEIAWESNNRASDSGGPFESIMGLVAALVCFFRSAMVLVGAICMRLGKNYRLAQAGAIMSCLGFVFYPLWFGVPFGIWALILLLRDDTRAAFEGPNQSS